MCNEELSARSDANLSACGTCRHHDDRQRAGSAFDIVGQNVQRGIDCVESDVERVIDGDWVIKEQVDVHDNCGCIVSPAALRTVYSKVS